MITHPELGLLALEVKGGRVAYDPATKRWTQTGPLGDPRLDEDPFHQAKGAMHSLVRILEGQPGWERWKPSYGFGVAFPDGRLRDRGASGRARRDRDRPRRPRAARRTRSARSCGRGRVRGDGSARRGWTPSRSRSGSASRSARRSGCGSTRRTRRSSSSRTDQAWVLAFVLHRRRAAVTGPAGSGKTVLAISVAQQLAAAGQRTLLTCFNRRLGEHLRASVGEVEGIDVATFHELCVRLAKEAGLELPPEEAGPGSPVLRGPAPEALAEAATRLGPRYDAIVVDEAQDFRAWWWPALLSLHTDPDDGLAVRVRRRQPEPLRRGACRSGRRTGSARSRTTCGTRSRSASSSRSSTRATGADRSRARGRARRDPRVRATRTISSGCSRWCSRTWSRRSRSRSRTSWC